MPSESKAKPAAPLSSLSLTQTSASKGSAGGSILESNKALPPIPLPWPSEIIRPARCLQFPLKTGSHKSSLRAPIVAQAFMGMETGLVFRSLFNCSAGIAKPRLFVTRDLIVRIPKTLPSKLTIGPPLLPGSMGIATCSISLPSISRFPEITPETTLCLSPWGFPTATTLVPSWKVLESEIAKKEPLGLTALRIAKSFSRSNA